MLKGSKEDRATIGMMATTITSQVDVLAPIAML